MPSASGSAIPHPLKTAPCSQQEIRCFQAQTTVYHPQQVEPLSIEKQTEEASTTFFILKPLTEPNHSVLRCPDAS